MKKITNLTFYGNKTFANVKEVLKRNGVKKFTNVRQSFITIDGVLVTLTRFEFMFRGKQYFAACEPETDIFEIDTKPIKNIE